MSFLGKDFASEILGDPQEELPQDTGDFSDSQDKHDTPIDRLPTELLENIFMDVIPYPTPFRPEYRLTIPFVFVLSMICRRWRDIVLNETRFWSGISLALSEYDSEENCATTGRVIRKFLSRSRGAPLLLHLSVQSVVNERHLEILSSLTEHAKQYWNLDFITYPKPLLDPTIQNLLSQLSTVKHLSLIPCFPLSNPLDVFRDCSSLSSFVLSGSPDVSMVALSWRQLTHMEIIGRVGNINIQSLTTVLGLCNSLRSLEIHTAVDLSTLGLSVTLPQLENLVLVRINLDRLRITITPPVLLPRLSGLSLDEYVSEGTWNIPQYLSFLTPLSQTLTKLLWCFPKSETVENFLSILQVLPNLEELCVAQPFNASNNMFTKHFFERIFAYQSGPSPILPRLRKLVIRIGAKNPDIDGLYQAVKSRILPDPTSNPGGRTYIQSLDINSKMPNFGYFQDLLRFSDHELDVLYSLRDFGLAVDVF